MRGAVAAGHRLTAEAGAKVLAAGGNAVDACIAAAAVSWVVESPLTGPGAGGFMLVHRARDRRDLLLDFFVAIPGRGLTASGRPPMDRVDVPFLTSDTTQTFLIGPSSCAVPGAVAGLAEAHRLYGTVPWADLLAPAIELARGGFELNASQSFLHAVLDSVLRREAQGRRVYGEERAHGTGARIVMAELADTLELLAAEGAECFYSGGLGRRIAAGVQEAGGRITESDLADYRVIRRRPVRAAYRGHELVSNPPPSSGGVLIAFALRLLDRLGIPVQPGSAEEIDRLAAVAREATRARRAPFVRDLYRGGLAPRLLAENRIEEGCVRILAGAPSPGPDASVLPSTTHLSVLDERGNAASLSASTGCGSGFFVPGTGIHLNNMLGEIDLNPPQAPHGPGRRLTSMMAPSILLRDGVPRLVIGSAGSERLRGAIIQTIVNVVDHGLSLEEAIALPRIHLDGDELHCEGGIDVREAERLSAFGYSVVPWPGTERNPYFGGVSAVAVAEDGGLEAAGDPRRGGAGVIVA